MSEFQMYEGLHYSWLPQKIYANKLAINLMMSNRCRP